MVRLWISYVRIVGIKDWKEEKEDYLASDV